MTYREFITLAHREQTEFEIFFKRDTFPMWDKVKVREVSEEGCVLAFLEEQPRLSNPLYVPSPVEDVAYEWSALTEAEVDMKEIWV